MLFIIPVHGTGDSAPYTADQVAAWWNHESDFAKTVLSNIEALKKPGGENKACSDLYEGRDYVWLPFEWSGANSEVARMSAGKALAHRILAQTRDLYGDKPPKTDIDDPVQFVLITHSHGGNVAIEAMVEIDRLKTIPRWQPFLEGVTSKTKDKAEVEKERTSPVQIKLIMVGTPVFNFESSLLPLIGRLVFNLRAMLALLMRHPQIWTPVIVIGLVNLLTNYGLAETLGRIFHMPLAPTVRNWLNWGGLAVAILIVAGMAIRALWHDLLPVIDKARKAIQVFLKKRETLITGVMIAVIIGLGGACVIRGLVSGGIEHVLATAAASAPDQTIEQALATLQGYLSQTVVRHLAGLWNILTQPGQGENWSARFRDVLLHCFSPAAKFYLIWGSCLAVIAAAFYQSIWREFWMARRRMGTMSRLTPNARRAKTVADDATKQALQEGLDDKLIKNKVEPTDDANVPHALAVNPTGIDTETDKSHKNPPVSPGEAAIADAMLIANRNDEAILALHRIIDLKSAPLAVPEVISWLVEALLVVLIGVSAALAVASTLQSHQAPVMFIYFWSCVALIAALPLSRVLSSPASNFVNRMVGAIIRQRVLGDDHFARPFKSVTAHLPLPEIERWHWLHPNLENAQSDHSSAAMSEAVMRAKELLVVAQFTGNQQLASAIERSGVINWDALIHTTYFKCAPVKNFIAYLVWRECADALKRTARADAFRLSQNDLDEELKKKIPDKRSCDPSATEAPVPAACPMPKTLTAHQERFEDYLSAMQPKSAV